MINSNSNNIPAVLFARISSREQEQGVSIEAQLASVYEYCKRKQLDIFKEFAITESSVRGDRKQFKEMMRLVKSRRGKVAIVVNCVDRLQRSYKDTPELDDLRRRDKIEVHFIKENLIIHKNSTGMEIMFWNMSVLMANSYVLSLSDNVKRSMKFNQQNGKWQALAPLGYINKRGEDGKAYVETDPIRAPSVQQLFFDFSTGLYTVTDIYERAKVAGLTHKTGRPVLRATIYKMLTNPFYYGFMRLDRGENLLPHIYDKLITEQMFNKCQRILRERGRKGLKKLNPNSKEFAFRGLVRCGECGSMVSCEHHKKKSGAEFVYLKCHSFQRGTGCKQQPVNEKVLFEQLKTEVFDKITPEKVSVINKHLGKLIVKNTQIQQNNQNILKKQKAEQEQKKSALLDLLIANNISKYDYDFKVSEINRNIAILDNQMSVKPGVTKDLLRKLQEVFSVLLNANNIFSGSNIPLKRHFLKILSLNQSLKDKNLRISAGFPVNLFTENDLYLIWLRSVDLNHRPSGYEPDELPGCSTPRQWNSLYSFFTDCQSVFIGLL